MWCDEQQMPAAYLLYAANWGSNDVSVLGLR